MKVKNFQSIFLLVLFSFTTYSSYAFGTLYYTTTMGPDYDYYKRYFSYFYGELQSTNLEQGLLYFFSTSHINTFRSEYINPSNNLEFISNSIQTTNFIFYLIGIFGIGFFLKHRKFNINIILTVLTLLNFFPPLYELRLLFKPEIIIFPTFVWTVNFLNKYLQKQEVKYLIFTMFPIVIMLSSKANTAVMVVVFLTIFYLKKIYNVSPKNFYISFFLFVVTYLLISIENYYANGLLIYQHNLPEGFDGKAGFQYLFNLDVYSLITDPFRHSQKDSFVGVMLLDTFNDYFTITWNDDSSIFALNSIIIVSSKLKPFISITLTLLMYFLFILKLFSKDESRYYYAAPFVGIIIQMLISQFTGYNPENGDIAKTYYYAFFLVIPFSLFFADSLKRNFKLFVPVILVFCAGMTHIVGFPKQTDTSKDSFISFNNQISIFCEANNLLLIGKNSDCINLENYCELSYNPNNKTVIINSEYYQENLLIENWKLQFDQNENTKTLSTIEECRTFIKNGWEPSKTNITKNYPNINIMTLIIFLLSILSYSTTTIKKDTN